MLRLAILFFLLINHTLVAAELKDKKVSFEDIRSSVKSSIDHGIRYLRSQQKDGVWLAHPGVTALCLQAFFTCPRKYNLLDGPFIRLPVEYLISKQDSEGAFYDPKSRAPAKNYCTSLAILALHHSGEKKYQSHIKKARDFLIGIQADEGESYDAKKDYFYGGIGYGGDQRPDLSNLHLALEALNASGLDKNHPAFKKALVFVGRCQDNESNDLSWAKGSGGFAYSPDVPTNKNLPTEKASDQLIVPYGSMTFAGIKSLIFCNVAKDDPRVQDALRWVKKHFVVDHHPGMGQISLFYYYFTLAKALNLLQLDMLKLEDGRMVDWRTELAQELLSRQKENGSWKNKKKKYMEGIPVLATAYAVNTLNLIYEKP